MTTEPLVRLGRVSFGYDPTSPVLREVDLAIGTGDRLSLTGPNGSGKTTLLHLVVGLLRPTSGVVEAFGRPRRAEADFREVRARVGLVFQCPDDQLFCPTVLEDVAFGPLNLGRRRHEALADAEATLARLDLSHLSERVTYGLSYGQKRMVALATVLAMRPDILLLDEPTDGLDPPAVERLLEALADFGGPLLMVSHDDRPAQALDLRRLALRDGQIVDVRND